MTTATTIAAPDGVSVLAHVTSMLNQHAEAELRLLHEMDMRYLQQFTASQEALRLALNAQQAAMEAALVSADKRTQAQLDAAKEAVTKAETATNIRLEAMNEFRKAYQDLIATMMSRVEIEGRLAGLAEKIAEGVISKDREHLAIREVIQAIDKRLTSVESVSVGKQQSWGILLGAIAATGILVGIVSRLIG